MNKFLDPFRVIDTSDFIFTVEFPEAEYREVEVYHTIDNVQLSIEENKKDLLYIKVYNLNNDFLHRTKRNNMKTIEKDINNIIKKNIKYPGAMYNQLLTLYNYDMYIYNSKDISAAGMFMHLKNRIINHPCFNLYTIMNHDLIHQYTTGDIIETVKNHGYFEYILDNGGNPFTDNNKFNIKNEYYMEYSSIIVSQFSNWFDIRRKDNSDNSLHTWDDIVPMDEYVLSDEDKEYIKYINNIISERGYEDPYYIKNCLYKKSKERRML